MGDYFFVDPIYTSDDAKHAFESTSKDKIEVVLKAMSDVLLKEENWQVDTLNSHLKEQQKALGLKTNEFMMPLRWAITGKKVRLTKDSLPHTHKPSDGSKCWINYGITWETNNIASIIPTFEQIGQKILI